jgi:23S rRNA pseudouridine1911/1915/1917 synthase
VQINKTNLLDKITVIFEDQDIVIVSKPSGVVTNAAVSVKEKSLQEWFTDNYLQNKTVFPEDWQKLVPVNFSTEYGSPEEIFEQRQGMVHRLDKDTSGVMIFAKHPGSLVNLLAQFRKRKTQKKYLTLVHGAFRVPAGVISAPLARARVDRRKFAVDVSGRAAETKYLVKTVYRGFQKDDFVELEEKKAKLMKQSLRFYDQGFSLVHCWPKTGRTHQIRVHMAHEQHPLVGDVTYLGRKRAKIDPIWCPRQFLHAETLEVFHPRTQKKVEFKAPLADDLQQVLDFLKEK